MQDKILIGIGTYKRNEMLSFALENISKLIVPENCKIEVVVSDNNLNKEAFSVFNHALSYFPFTLHYSHTPEKSIAAVRNAVLKKALEIDAQYVAFLDDDEYPKPDWILELYKTLTVYSADASTSAPVPIEDGKEQLLPYNVRRRKTGDIRKLCITNSVLFKIEIVKDSNIWFDTSYGLMTGEDIDFFTRAKMAGYKFVWCEKTLIYEHVQKNRESLSWKIDRAFNNGYLTIFIAKKYKANIKSKYFKTVIDICIFSFIYIISFIFPKKYNEKCLIKLFNCFGKLNSFYTEGAYTHYKRND